MSIIMGQFQMARTHPFYTPLLSPSSLGQETPTYIDRTIVLLCVHGWEVRSSSLSWLAAHGRWCGCTILSTNLEVHFLKRKILSKIYPPPPQEIGTWPSTSSKNIPIAEKCLLGSDLVNVCIDCFPMVNGTWCCAFTTLQLMVLTSLKLMSLLWVNYGLACVLACTSTSFRFQLKWPPVIHRFQPLMLMGAHSSWHSYPTPAHTKHAVIEFVLLLIFFDECVVIMRWCRSHQRCHHLHANDLSYPQLARELNTHTSPQTPLCSSGTNGLALIS